MVAAKNGPWRLTGATELTPSQARTVRAARRGALRALEQVLGKIETGAYDAAISKYFGLRPTPAWRAELTRRYRKVYDFLSSFDASGFAYVPWSRFYAAVYPDDPTAIYLGQPFFSYSDTYGRDSRAGTLIHEVTHLVLGTDDHGYGDMAMGLSTTNAVNNGDSYEYFIEEAEWLRFQGKTATPVRL